MNNKLDTKIKEKKLVNESDIANFVRKNWWWIKKY